MARLLITQFTCAKCGDVAAEPWRGKKFLPKGWALYLLDVDPGKKPAETEDLCPRCIGLLEDLWATLP